MEKKNYIAVLTLLLSVVAGFCDTATFVAGGSVFSAHVTGNFIVFAAQVVLGHGDGGGEWIKLLTFPVFIVAVFLGGKLIGKSGNKYTVLLVEAALLFTAVVSSVLGAHFLKEISSVLSCFTVMITVAAMGLQNAFGKLYAKETYGPTTMMTGNVTQASLDVGALIGKNVPVELYASLKKDGFLIAGFLVGCLAGAIVSKMIGLTAICIPAVVLLTCYFMLKPNGYKE